MVLDSIDRTITRYLNLDQPTRKLVMDDIAARGAFRVFGYGSLIRNPAYGLDDEYPGYVEGWECGPFCKDRFLRGVTGDLGITMGALPSPGARLLGMVQEIRIDPRADARKLFEAIRKFARREISLNPIYRYNVVDVATRSDGVVKALICRADESSPLFLGRDRTAPGTRGLTLLEKAAVIATASGVPGAADRSTGLDYWRFVLHCRYRAGMPPERHIRELVEAANAMRAVLPRGKRDRLERMERGGLLSGRKERLDRRVFRCSARLGSLKAREVVELRRRARMKMGLFELLRPDQRARTERRFRELHR